MWLKPNRARGCFSVREMAGVHRTKPHLVDGLQQGANEFHFKVREEAPTVQAANRARAGFSRPPATHHSLAEQ